MTRRFRFAMPAALLAAVLAAPPAGAAAAQDQGKSERERAEDMAREGMERIMRALEMLMQSIPQYELPEIDGDGDIIIRRKRRLDERAPKKPDPEPEPEPDSTDT